MAPVPGSPNVGFLLVKYKSQHPSPHLPYGTVLRRKLNVHCTSAQARQSHSELNREGHTQFCKAEGRTPQESGALDAEAGKSGWVLWPRRLHLSPNISALCSPAGLLLMNSLTAYRIRVHETNKKAQHNIGQNSIGRSPGPALSDSKLCRTPDFRLCVS